MEQGREESRVKKEYLRGYEKAVRQMERSELKIREIRLCRVCPPIAMDGMPHSHNNNDLSSYAALLERAEKEYMKHRYRRIQKCQEITARIEGLEDEDEKDILMYRYIKLMRWDEICERMKLSYRRVHYIHGSALKNLKI